ncbi:TPA: hypothetical protein RJD49_000488 [Legionella pneumophila]|nr:hypothetical protein [Legionella pneumophila]HDV5804867.1 hypothetical protein [Legionella pneumophila]
MQNEKDVKERIQADKKKRVSWNDNKTQGQIDKKFLKIGTASSPNKSKLNKKISQLMEEGYSETEATSIVGKSVTPSGKIIFNDPIFYDSQERIEMAKANRYSFFSVKEIVFNVVIGTVLAAGVFIAANNS